MSYSKSKEKIPNNAPGFLKKPAPVKSINEQFFIKNMEKSATYLLDIGDQLDLLQKHCNHYANHFAFENSVETDEEVATDLKKIYTLGACVKDILEKINPDTLFDPNELNKHKMSAYQLQYDVSRRQFKILWVSLYDLKQAHQSQKLFLVEKCMQAKYPNAKKEEVTTLSERVIRANCLSEVAAFAKHTTAVETLNYVTLRYKEILKLEASVDELHQLFVDMWALTQQQGYTIDKIRDDIQSAKELIKSGKNDLEESYLAKKKHWYSV